MTLNYIDIIFITVILLMAVKGTIVGFITELFSLLSLLGSLIIATVYYGYGASFLSDHLGPAGRWNDYLGFLLIFLIVFVSMKLIGFFLKKIIAKMHMQSFDHILGFILGLLEGSFLIIFVYYLIVSQPVIPPEKVLGSSMISGYIDAHLPGILKYLPEIKG